MATADVRTFWGAFVRVLLKCIAALGFAAPARTRVRVAEVTGPVGRTAMTASGTASGTGLRTEGGTGTIPAPRCAHPYANPYAYAYPPRRDRRGRTLPPTMKQRIRAEAHGATPTARSVLAADGATPTAAGAAGSNAIPTPRTRADEAVCD